MADLLLEIGTEEIPAGFVAQALADLKPMMADALTRARLPHGDVEVFGTPRRLAVRVAAVAERQADETREVLGPPVRAAFDATGAPTKAGAGFAKTNNVEPSALLRVQTPKGEYVGVRIHEVGRAALEVLGAVLAEVCTKLPFQKSMRWGTEKTRFARPVHWLVALLGEDVVPFEFAGVQSGRNTRGHRFHDPREVPLARPADYEDALRAVNVVASPKARRDEIVRELQRVGAERGGTPVYDDALLDEVAYLVEKPFAIAVEFPRKYLSVPKEVLLTVMRKQQRYFAYETSAGGELTNHFAFIANTKVRDPKVVADGALKVTRARFDDALFYLREDQKKPLAERVESLRGIVFMRGLGTIFEKTERIAALAQHLFDGLSKADRTFSTNAQDAAHLQAAARLAKADLTTGIVREFPELQGYVGRRYAIAEGQDSAIAEAILDHYKPRGAADTPPQTTLGALVSLADKLDSLAGCFRIGQEPTGTADPLALRRQTLGIVKTLGHHGWHVGLSNALDHALAGFDGTVKTPAAEPKKRLLTFIEGRLRADWTQEHAADVVDAVLAAGFDDVVEARARLHALAAAQGSPAFAPVAVTFRRVAKILKEEIAGDVEPARFEHAEEAALHDATATALHDVRARLAARDFAGALSRLEALGGPVDAFFGKVFVMHEDAAIKRNRLALLRDVKALSQGLVDFGRLAGE